LDPRAIELAEMVGRQHGIEDTVWALETTTLAEYVHGMLEEHDAAVAAKGEEVARLKAARESLVPCSRCHSAHVDNTWDVESLNVTCHECLHDEDIPVDADLSQAYIGVHSVELAAKDRALAANDAEIAHLSAALAALSGHTRYECKECGGTKLEVEAKDALLQRAIKLLGDLPPYLRKTGWDEDRDAFLKEAQEAQEAVG
jgi:hypothetical protein